MANIEVVSSEMRLKINYPDHFEFPDSLQLALEECAKEITAVTGKEIYGVYFNPDRNDPARLHDVKFVFKKKI